MQLAVLTLAECVFQNLDWGALRLKQMFAAEVMRLETESGDAEVQRTLSVVLRRFPEIRAIQWAKKGSPRAYACLR